MAKPDFWKNTKRYYDLKSYWRNLFGCNVHKLPIDAGFTCPNRDGHRCYWRLYLLRRPRFQIAPERRHCPQLPNKFRAEKNFINRTLQNLSLISKHLPILTRRWKNCGHSMMRRWLRRMSLDFPSAQGRIAWRSDVIVLLERIRKKISYLGGAGIAIHPR